MPRKKIKLFGVSYCEPDTKHPSINPTVNFVCDETKLEESFLEVDDKKIFHQESYKKDLYTALKNRLKNNVQFIGNDMVFFDEISLSERLKPSDQYLYRLIDYNGLKTIYCTFKGVLTEVNKRIKNKYAKVWYNGVTEKIVYNENEFANILSRMTPETHEVSIAQMKGNGEEDDLILITPYKLM